jgi:hypothetical protein
VSLFLRIYAAKDQILRSDADPVPVAKGGGLSNESAIHANAVAASEILDPCTVGVDDDLGMLARDKRILDRQVAIEAPPDDGDPPR